MFQPQDDFNQDRSQNTQNSSSDPNLENIDANISPESVAVRKKQLESIFIKLIVFGLVLGAVLGISAYYLLHKFGLTKRPEQLEQEKIEQEEQNSGPPAQKINNFPASDTDAYRFRV